MMMFVVFSEEDEWVGVFSPLTSEQEGKKRAIQYFGNKFEKLIYVEGDRPEEVRQLMKHYRSYNRFCGRITKSSRNAFYENLELLYMKRRSN